MASFPPSHRPDAKGFVRRRHLRKPHIVSTMLGFASTEATDASVSTQSGQHPRFDLTKNKLITNIRYFENAALEEIPLGYFNNIFQ